MTINTSTDTNTASHTKVEDILAIITGTFIIGFGIILAKQAGVMLGGVMGLALLVHHMTDVAFGVLFFLLNLPFYYLAYRRLGMPMVIKTLMAVSLLSLMTELHPLFVSIANINPLYGAVFANVMLGLGLLILFRHRSSLGGFNLLALYVQEHHQIPAGKVQMAMDAGVLLLSLVYVDWRLIMVSIVGVVVLNVVLIMNHRQDRYIGR